MDVLSSHKGRAWRAAGSNFRLQHTSPRTRARRLRDRNHAPRRRRRRRSQSSKLSNAGGSCTVLVHDLLKVVSIWTNNRESLKAKCSHSPGINLRYRVRQLGCGFLLFFLIVGTWLARSHVHMLMFRTAREITTRTISNQELIRNKGTTKAGRYPGRYSPKSFAPGQLDYPIQSAPPVGLRQVLRCCLPIEILIEVAFRRAAFEVAEGIHNEVTRQYGP